MADPKGLGWKRFEGILTIFMVLGLIVTFAMMLSVLSSSSDEQTLESVQSGFMAREYMEELTKHSSDCQLEYIAESRIIPGNNWKSKRWSEVEKYWWIEYSEVIDDYKYRVVDPRFGDIDKEDIVNVQSCIDFLSSQITKLETLSDDEALALLSLYKELFENKTNYLVPANSVVALLPLTNSKRADYLKLEDQKRELAERNKKLFYSIRALIDYYEYYPGIKVYLERCPTAFNYGGPDYIEDGSALLVNESSSNINVSFTVRFKDDGVIVGDDYINENVPANSTVRVLISAGGASGAVTGGHYFPPVCSIHFEG